MRTTRDASFTRRSIASALLLAMPLAPLACGAILGVEDLSGDGLDAGTSAGGASSSESSATTSGTSNSVATSSSKSASSSVTSSAESGSSSGSGGAATCDMQGVTSVPCYEGADGTEGVGLCKAGTAECVDGGAGACMDQVVP